MTELAKKKKAWEIANLSANIMKLELRELEIEEEKAKLADTIQEQKERLETLKEEE